MTDAKITGSQSRFVQRTADDKLQFMVEAFRFQDVGRVSGSNHSNCNAIIVGLRFTPKHIHSLF